MSRDVLPFLVPDPSAVEWGLWKLLDEGEAIDLPPTFPTWDYQTDLHLQRVVRVDVERVRAQAGLPHDTALQLVVEWVSSESQLQGLACSSLVESEGPTLLAAHLRGTELGGRLSLATRLTLAVDLSQIDPFVASRVGDILLEEKTETLLQGVAGMFPTSLLDFAAAGLDPDARWFLDIPMDVSVPVAGGLRLYLNRRDKEVVAAAVGAARPSVVHKRLLEALHTDLTRQLVEAALRPPIANQLRDRDHGEDPDSVGASMSALLNHLFHPDPPEALRALQESDPGRFAARVQGAIRRLMREDL
ncbi:hypothetical protein ACQEVF_22935 [Nonomuraea polychroma]|uniref:hypothetical protein n=1 Tax=Nonomuraea polychroma TaxID=46176 RepID=UPI003D8E58C7